MAADIESGQLLAMFGQNLFAKSELLPLYRELWGVAGFKPFECVGTPEEAQAACYLVRQAGAFAATPVMTEFAKHVLPRISDPDRLVRELLTPDLDETPAVTRTILEAGGAL
jgi:hypothetical protein